MRLPRTISRAGRGCQVEDSMIALPKKGSISALFNAHIARDILNPKPFGFPTRYLFGFIMWVVVKIMVPFCVPIIITGPNLGDPKRNHNFDNPPCISGEPQLPYFADPLGAVLGATVGNLIHPPLAQRGRGGIKAGCRIEGVWTGFF